MPGQRRGKFVEGSDPVNGFELANKRNRASAKLLRGFGLTDSFPRFRPPHLARREDWCGLMLRQAALGSNAVFRVLVAPAPVTAGALTTKVWDLHQIDSPGAAGIASFVV